MPSTLLLSSHVWALKLAATVAKGHTRGKRGHRWVVENNAGTEVVIVKIDKAGADQQTQFLIRKGAVILVLEGVLGNNGTRYGEGTIVCLHDGEIFAPSNSNPRSDCWYTVLWFTQPETLPTP